MLTRFFLISFSLLLTFIPCQAQSSKVESLMKFAGNIHQFNSLFPQEKVYLQFDNTSYYTGETIWFKAFVTSASTLGRAQSKVLYVDLLSPTGVLLKQQKLKIVAGQADGSFPLLDGATAQAREKRGVVGYPSGFYEVRAYTSYMLNFDNEILFSRVLAVYDPPKEEGNYYESSPVITLRRSETSEFRPKTEKLRKINASFYPEGGHLVIGKPCRVAFKVTDDTGFGVDATGSIEGKGISFSTIHDGMGSFTFTPQEKLTEVEITVDGTSRSFNLPEAEPSGYVMAVNPLGSDSISISVDGAGLTSTTLGIGLTCRGELMDFGTIETGSSPAEMIISLRGVPEGVCRVYLFDKKGIQYASRSFYHRSKVVKAPVLEVKSDKDSYGPFEKITLDFTLTDKESPFRDRFCLSVHDSRTQNNAYTDDLRTSMLLSSDLKGFIEHPSWYFDSDAPERDEALDLLCLVQGWERYDWDIMTGQKQFSERHRMEESLTLNGWILNSSGKKKMEDVQVSASLVPQDKTQTEIYSYTTDKLGYFGFDIGAEFYDKAKFTISATTNRENLIGTSARIQIDRPTSPSIRAYTPGELVFTGIKGGGSKKNVKKSEDEIEFPTVINIETGYLLPDVDIDEERMYIDYFTFNAFDVVKDVELELDKGDYSSDLMGYLIDKGYEVVLSDSGGTVGSINGWEPFFYIHNSSKYLYQGIYEHPGAIDARDIKSIIVFDRPMFFMNILTQCHLYQEYLNASIQTIFGEDLYRRMVLVDIQIKDEAELSTRDELFKINKRITTVDGYSRPYSFYSPEYPNGPILGDVDYRRTLYWNPNVITDEEGKAQVEFYNNSITKHFNIEAAGITSAGVPYILDTGF
ncbi:MAG: hypothetical protein IKX55_03985 [Bacteroidaceae bacterium]|nr:hypothetical protein [Bacteroidaceae bacterium]